MDTLADLLWPVAVVLSVYRLAAAWERFVPTPPTASADPVEIPEDLIALAMAHRESWAQEDLLRVIREQYDELKDWNRVRAAMNIGRMGG